MDATTNRREPFQVPEFDLAQGLAVKRVRVGAFVNLVPLAVPVHTPAGQRQAAEGDGLVPAVLLSEAPG